MVILKSTFITITTLLLHPSKCETCPMLGLIYPFEDASSTEVEKEVKQMPGNVCFTQDYITKNKIFNCCSEKVSKRINLCWEKSKSQVEKHRNTIINFINRISKAENIVFFNQYFNQQNQNPSQRRRIMLSKSKKRELELIEKFNKVIEKFEPNKRILSTTEEISVAARIEQAVKEMKMSLSSNFLKQNFARMFIKEASKCWTYYFSIIQRGFLCSLCIEDSSYSSPRYNLFKDENNQTINFNFATCDDFIPKCIKMIQMVHLTSRFMRNSFILIINKLYQGGSLLDKNVRSFMELYEQPVNTTYLDDCLKSANCDNLCNQNIQLGVFSNDHIIGDRYLFHQFEALLNKFKEISDKKIKETLYSNERGIVSTQFIEVDVLKQWTIKKYLSDRVKGGNEVRRMSWEAYKLRYSENAVLMKEYPEIITDYVCFADTGDKEDLKKYEDFFKISDQERLDCNNGKILNSNFFLKEFF